MKKVLFIATVVKTHINEFHLPYIKEFHYLGWQVDVAARNDFVPKEKLDIPYCDNFYEIAFKRSPFSWQNIVAYRDLKRIIKKESYNLLICNTPVGGALGRWAGRNVHGLNIVYICHGFHFYKGNRWYKNIVYKNVEKFLARYTDCLLTINNEDYEAACKFKLRTPKSVYKINSIGCDLKRFKLPKNIREIMRKEIGVLQNDFVVITVAELNFNKNQKTAIKAFCKANIPQSVYLLCGMGECEEELKREVKKMGVEDRVHFLGYRNDVPELLSMSDCFLFTSKREGLSMATVEAMAAGLPVIVSDIRGPRDCIIKGESGFSYAPDDVVGFSVGLKKIYNASNEERRYIRDLNIKHSVRFSIEEVVKEVFQIYKRMGYL